MKLSSINNIGNKNNYSQNASNKQQSTNFKGAGLSNSLVNFWQFVDNGGRALQFTVEDMTGTNIPRSIKGAKAGCEYTGKINIPGLLQEALREFFTGPTMCVVPVFVLNAAMKLGGKTTNTHVENIQNLSHMMGQTVVNEGQSTDKEFVKTAVKDMLEKTTGKDNIQSQDINKLSEQINNYRKITNKKEGKKALSSLQSTFESIVKKSKDNYQDANFLNAKYSISKNKTGETSFKNYVDYISAYAEDFTKKFGNDAAGLTKSNIDKFKNNFIGRRILTIVGMFAITSVLMVQIPKIYTKASGKVNPNASAIYDEAKGLNKKEQPQQNKEVK